MNGLEATLRHAFDEAPDKVAFVNEVRGLLHSLAPTGTQPVDFVRWVPVEEVVANDYNPNSVAPNEMRLLHVSIAADGYTQPIVTMWDDARGKYVVVDGFHRYLILRTRDDIRARTGGLLPIVVIEKAPNERMAATVRHNRARGRHSVAGMSNIVFQMLDNGWEDTAICHELGMEADELIRLKHLTGFAKLFENVEYRRAWEAKRQIELRREWREQHGDRDGSDRADQALLAEPSAE